MLPKPRGGAETRRSDDPKALEDVFPAERQRRRCHFTPQLRFASLPNRFLPASRLSPHGTLGAAVPRSGLAAPLLPCAGARPRPAPPNRQTAPFPSIHESVTSARSWASLQQAAGSGGWNFLLFCNTSFYFFLPSIFLKQENGASHREP